MLICCQSTIYACSGGPVAILLLLLVENKSWRHLGCSVPLLFPGLAQCNHREVQCFIEVPCSEGRDVKENTKCVSCRLQSQGAALCGCLGGHGEESPWKGRAGDQPLPWQHSAPGGWGIAASPDGQIWICLLQPPCSDKETGGCVSPAKEAGCGLSWVTLASRNGW